ncbi:nephrin-like [Tachypleus tridentatus]|uniref:nephrin-like n=1 Tax=Tachypleus tridentatus TaxID=6853 RepID=UPI003FD0DB78
MFYKNISREMTKTNELLMRGIIFVFALFTVAEPKQQYFLLKPSDTVVIEGLTAMLQCKIKNLAGVVQWSKDGFLLGFDPVIPGFKRYSMIIDKGEGIYNLRISNTMVEDEGTFQCQAGPASDEGPIRAGASLTVLVPPTLLTINGRPRHAVLRIKEGERANLTCSAENSKPPSRLKWYRNRVQLIPDAAETSILEENGKLVTILSTLTLYPKIDDDQATYTCEADHLALSNPLTSSVTISVLYPPGKPVISGYREGKVLVKGERLSLLCTSKGGNPPASLIWFRSGDRLVTSYVTRSRKTVSILRFRVTAADNQAVYRCEADSPLVYQSSSDFVTLSVRYPPGKVHLKGPSNARRGETVTIVCVTTPSNPATQLSWLVDGEPVTGGENSIRNISSGWITSSNLTLTITRQDPDTKTFVCRAGNPQIGIIEGKKQIKVIYPPDKPTIVGYTQGLTMQAGDILRFDCVAFGGNPIASLQWYRGNTQISTLSRVAGSGVSNELVLKAQREDNGAIYRCEASNLATSHPVAAFMKIFVTFPAGKAAINVQPAQPKAGEEVTISCSTDSSNPESRVTWWKNGHEIITDRVQTVSSDFEGYSTTSSLKLWATPKDNGAVYTCFASNGVSNSAPRDDFVLSVLYKPEFMESAKDVVVLEGESVTVNISAKGNPSTVRYHWSRDGVPLPLAQEMITSPRITAEGPLLHLRDATRKDSGSFHCVAKNSEGSSNATVELNVLYSATVFNLTDDQMAVEGENVTLECSIDANPITYGSISWTKLGSQAVLTSKSLVLGRSFLELTKVTRDVSGIYECNAYNGIGLKDAMAVEVVVMYKPVIFQPVIQYNSGYKDDAIIMSCTVDATPNATISWYLGSQLIIWTAIRSNYRVQYHNDGRTVWTSTLHVKKLYSSTFGNYTCRAENYVGYSSAILELTPFNFPEISRNVSVSSVTHNSVLISWQTGFNGVLPQTFTVLWRKVGETRFSKVKGITGLSYLAQGLDPETDYEFFITAFNKSGISEKLAECFKVRTKSAPLMDSTKTVTNEGKVKDGKMSRLMWMTCTVSGAIILVLVTLLVACSIRHLLYRKRTRADVVLQLPRMRQTDHSLKPVNNTGGPPFFLSGTKRAEYHGASGHLQFSDGDFSWNNDSKNEEFHMQHISHFEKWGGDQIRKLGRCESSEHNNHQCPDILQQFTLVNKSEAFEENNANGLKKDTLADQRKDL